MLYLASLGSLSPSLKSLKMTQFPILSYSKLFFE